MKIFIYTQFKGDSTPFVVNTLQTLKMPLDGFYKDELGCPKLVDAFISISHSCDTIAIAVSNKKVGIDIERKDRRISKELISIENWTQRESYAKFLGTGLNRKILNNSLPLQLLTTFEHNNYIFSVCSEDKTISIIE